jgi:hypothetical protein
MKIEYKGIKEEGSYVIGKITVVKDIITVHFVPVDDELDKKLGISNEKE